jgi:hypothetical protein
VLVLCCNRPSLRLTVPILTNTFSQILPLLDEVLSINKCNFRGNPNVVEANDLIHNSLVVEMEILKTGYKIDPDLFRTNGDDSFERTKYCLGGNFFCARPQRLEQKGRTFSINGSAASPGPISV